MPPNQTNQNTGEVQVCILGNNFKSCMPPNQTNQNTGEVQVCILGNNFKSCMPPNMEIDQTDQLGDDGDMDDEDDADESDEERTADPNFLVPTYENEPDPNDIFGTSNICITNYACMHMDLFHCKEEQCPLERESIRKVVKEMEPTIRVIQSGKKSVFLRHIPAIEKCLKADANWPLQHCYDMVHMFR
ncbi:hypothetical protein EMCRGX_G000166 [Ephydatia muelleri]